MTKNTRKHQQTAPECYAELRKEIAVLMNSIQTELKEHAERAKGSNDWGYVGDLGKIRQEATEILETLISANHLEG